MLIFFSGVYFDFSFTGSATVLLSLHNSIPEKRQPTKGPRTVTPTLPFLPLTNTSSAAPISLLARVDDEEYLVLPSASSLFSICGGILDPNARHEVRIIAPMVGRDSVETLQVQGIWLDEDGELLPYASESDSNKQSMKLEQPRKMIEIVTDLPGSVAGRDRGKSVATNRGILGGVMGWEYLLGEMFGSDHVMVGMDGMCLVSDCIGGRGSPAGLADVFFQR